MAEKDVVVIGGGQAGLAISYFLQKKQKDFVVLDANNRTGDSWRERYDSLRLFTPRMYNRLPGFKFDGIQDELPTREEAADYLERYAKYFGIPIHFGTKVSKLQKQKDRFTIDTNQGSYTANQVIIATGPFQKPLVPSFSGQLSERVYQVHSSAYRNPSQLLDGPVLVVGAGNSGAQIAVELSQDRLVTVAVGHRMNFKPLYMLGRSIFWYFHKLGLLQADERTKRGSWLKNQPEQVYGLELKRLLGAGKVHIRPRAIGVENDAVLFEDGSSILAPNVIWSTGFRPDYSWVDIPGLLNEKGIPIHHKGVSQVPGVYFIGLPWQTCRGSALIGWVGRDAEMIAAAL